jgi:hypothetical protein
MYPVDIHTARSFLGLANYFRRFIKGYALIRVVVFIGVNWNNKLLIS